MCPLPEPGETKELSRVMGHAFRRIGALPRQDTIARRCRDFLLTAWLGNIWAASCGVLLPIEKNTPACRHLHISFYGAPVAE